MGKMDDENSDVNQLVSAEYSDRSHEYEFEYTGSPFCNPSSRFHRYFVLIFMCMLAFGSYYCYDTPGALTSHIREDMNISQAAYDNLYSWYSYPNVILCFFGGFLIDAVFGIRMGAIIFAAIVCIGQVIFAGGAFFNTFPLMVFGRFIFGIGGESLTVAQNTYTILWFKGKELNTVFGVQLSIARLGSMATFSSMIDVYEAVEKYIHVEGHVALGYALLCAASLCLLSLFCAIVCAIFDKRAERILNREAAATGEVVNITDVFRFPLSFWMLCAICVTYYVAIFPFISNGSKFMTEKYKFSDKTANVLVGLPYIVSAIVSPICGIICDVTGMNLMWTLIASILSCACHVMLWLLPADIVTVPVASAIMGSLGVCFSMVACSFWPMVANVIPEHQLGTAYGVMQAIQNLGLAVVNQVAGIIFDKASYDWMEVFFMAWIICAIVSSVILSIYNRRIEGNLNQPKYKKLPCFRRHDDELTLQ